MTVELLDPELKVRDQHLIVRLLGTTLASSARVTK